MREFVYIPCVCLSVHFLLFVCPNVLVHEVHLAAIGARGGGGQEEIMEWAREAMKREEW